MRSLFDEYVQAKRRAKESTAGLSLEKLERSLRRQTERLRKKHGNKQIDYEVVTQNGRPLIRPKIK